MKALRKGSTGAAVRDWENFLLGRGFAVGIVDGRFDNKTLQATKDFQTKYKLKADGVVGNRTFAKAMLLDFGPIKDEEDTGKDGDNWPPQPKFAPLN